MRQFHSGAEQGGRDPRKMRGRTRVASRRLYVLQDLSGVGLALAQRLSIGFGSVERGVTADEESLAQVRGRNLPQGAVPKTVAPLRVIRCDSVRNLVAT